MPSPELLHTTVLAAEIVAMLVAVWLLRDYLFIALLLIFYIAAVVVMTILAIVGFVVLSPVIVVFLLMGKAKLTIIDNGYE